MITQEQINHKDSFVFIYFQQKLYLESLKAGLVITNMVFLRKFTSDHSFQAGIFPLVLAYKLVPSLETEICSQTSD